MRSNGSANCCPENEQERREEMPQDPVKVEFSPTGELTVTIHKKIWAMLNATEPQASGDYLVFNLGQVGELPEGPQTAAFDPDDGC
jgi:hypothetical protein